MTTALPPRAESAHDWETNGTRVFYGHDYHTGDALVSVVGVQTIAGVVLRRTGQIQVSGGTAELDAAQLREFAANCNAVADELGQFTRDR